MGLFPRKKALGDLSDRLDELSDQVRDLRTASKHLELEWEELYDKVRHQMSRMSKRAGVSENLSQQNQEPGSLDEQVPQVDAVSRSILLRRGLSRGR